jgi:hypothetical protein
MNTEPDFPTSLMALSFSKRLEMVAAILVGQVTKTELKELDPGGGPVQLPDFEIVDLTSASRVGVMEVTTSTRENLARLRSQFQRPILQSAELMWSWSIHTNSSADPGRLRRELGAVLLSLEESGPPEDWLPERPGLTSPETGSLPASLVELGVAGVCAWNLHVRLGDAVVSVQPELSGGMLSIQSALSREVQAELNKADNIAKLSCHSGRAELFVWLDIGDGALTALTLCDPPWDQALAGIAGLQLPGTVTAAWAATGIASWPRPATSLFRFDENGWKDFGRPSLP